MAESIRQNRWKEGNSHLNQKQTNSEHFEHEWRWNVWLHCNLQVKDNVSLLHKTLKKKKVEKKKSKEQWKEREQKVEKDKESKAKKREANLNKKKEDKKKHKLKKASKRGRVVAGY